MPWGFIDCPHKIILAGLLLEFIRGDSFGGFKHLPPIIIIGISYYLCNLLHGIVRVHRQHIYIKNVNTVTERNRRKGEILYKVRKTGKIDGIPYRIYFNSCNLEHVLYGELRDYSDEEKQIFSDEFADR